MSVGHTTRDTLNLPVVNGDFIIVGLTASVGTGTDLIRTIRANIAALPLTRNSDIKSIIISNDGGSDAWIKSQTGAAAGKGIKLADGDSLFLALASEADVDIQYETAAGATLSVAVFY